MNTGEKARVDWVDIAKGICIIFVVMMHSVLGVENEAGARGWMHACRCLCTALPHARFFPDIGSVSRTCD